MSAKSQTFTCQGCGKAFTARGGKMYDLRYNLKHGRSKSVNCSRKCGLKSSYQVREKKPPKVYLQTCCGCQKEFKTTGVRAANCKSRVKKGLNIFCSRKCEADVARKEGRYVKAGQKGGGNRWKGHVPKSQEFQCTVCPTKFTRTGVSLWATLKQIQAGQTVFTCSAKCRCAYARSQKKPKP